MRQGLDWDYDRGKFNRCGELDYTNQGGDLVVPGQGGELGQAQVEGLVRRTGLPGPVGVDSDKVVPGQSNRTKNQEAWQ